MNENIKNSIITAIPFGQLYTRFISLDGSLNHAWTLLPPFLFPPFSLVPAFMVFFGLIKKGTCGKVIDMYSLLSWC